MAKPNQRYREKIVEIDRRIDARGIDSILAVLFRKIMHENGAGNSNTFNRLLERFVGNPVNGIPNNVKERSSARGNLRKELLRAVMSWRVFCKGIRFMNIPRFDISITLYHQNKTTTVHSLTVNLGDSPIDSEDNEEDVE